MFPPSPFAIPVPSFPQPVPTPPDDPGECPLLTVTFNKAWLPVILGALDQLRLQTTWLGDQDTVVKAQQEAMYLKTLFIAARPAPECLPQPTDANCGCDDMGCSQLKYVNGVLGCDCCGTFTPVPGQPGNGGQPGPGQPQPAPGGGQQGYTGCLNANDHYRLPTLVSTGDTITLVIANGIWRDPTNDPVDWRCDSGEVAGIETCISGTTELVVGDPLNTAPHMCFLIVINGVYYDFSSGTFTVPVGIVNAQVELQPNDLTLTDNLGSICFVLNVVNNSLATWVKTLDYTGNPWSASGSNWVGASHTDLAPSWIPGVGWQQGPQSSIHADECQFCAVIQPLGATVTLTHIRMEMTVVSGTATGSTNERAAQVGHGGIPITSSDVSGSNTPMLGSLIVEGNVAFSTNVLDLEAQACSYLAASDATIKITKLILSGTGTPPPVGV